MSLIHTLCSSVPLFQALAKLLSSVLFTSTDSSSSYEKRETIFIGNYLFSLSLKDKQQITTFVYNKCTQCHTKLEVIHAPLPVPGSTLCETTAQTSLSS